jgi:hypothetical protein
MIGAADGFSLRTVGRRLRLPGRSACAALMAAWASRAAFSTSLSMSNWTAMLVEPVWLFEVSSVTPEISPSRRSSGAATVAAMVSGSAPGWLAEMRKVGISTLGRLATGRLK